MHGHGTMYPMKYIGRKTFVALSFLVASAVFVVTESFLYPLWLNIENGLKIIIDQPGPHALDIVDTLSMYAFLGGLIVSGLTAATVYLFLVTRSRAALASNMMESQDWLEELYQEAPVPYLLMNPKGNLELPNKAALRLFGSTAAVLVLLKLKDITIKEDREHLENLLDHFKRKAPVNGELLRIESKNKNVRSVLLSIFPGGKMGHSSGKALVTMVDITEQKRLESELGIQFSETQKFAKAAESSADGVVITDIDGRITYVNTAWTLLTGYAKEDAIGQPLISLHGGSTSPDVLAKVDGALRAKLAFKTEEMIHRRKDGREYNAEIEMIPIVDEESAAVQYYVYTERDISKRKEIDRAKSEFVSLASHQLRTPMLSMRWYTEMMLSGDTGVLTEKQREYVGKIYNGTQALVELVQLFLDVSKIEMGALQIQPTPLRAEVIIDSVLEELQPHMDKKMLHVEKNITLKQEITTDARLLRIVIQNLISNAVKYTGEKGTITIDIQKSGHNVVFSVGDTGCGIPTEEQHLIFSKMFRAHNAAKAAAHGFGLGLYMVKSIVESLGGSISFVSVLDRGTTFTFILPM